MKWLLSLVFITLFFIISSFFLPENLIFPYRFMTLGMATISFFFYILTVKSSHNNVGGSLVAIVLKFILSAFLFMAYYVLTQSKNNIDYYFFILAFVLYSIVCYIGAYFFTKNEN